MEKFSELEYVRPDIKAEKKEMKLYLKNFKKAVSFEEAEKALLAFESKIKTLFTTKTIANIRNDIDTSNEFYEGEVKYLNGAEAKLLPILRKEMKAVLASPFLKDIEEKYGNQITLQAKADLQVMSLSVIPLLIRENNLKMEYNKIVSSKSCKFRGEKCNFYGLLKHMESTDRTERKAAFISWAKMYEDISPKLDDIFDKLVKLRVKKAKRGHFDNFIDYSYMASHHFDYTPDDVAKFRAEIKRVVTPICNEIAKAQAERLGVEKLKFYDEKLLFVDGNADPIGDKNELLKKTLNMYTELSPETKEFFEFMYEHDLFDLETKANKNMGGYCTLLPDYKAPFIFSNFNGTSADVEVLTHEAGHCFNMYRSIRHNTLISTLSSTNETNEIHSMSMEFFSYPWWKDYFGEDEDKAKFVHMVGCLTMLPYIVSVDEFQHEVFKNPTMTARDRRAVWHKIEKEYMPWRDYDENEFLHQGGFWMQKLHIFLSPFYYVDYALAQLNAFEFYTRSLEDKENTWKDYVNLCTLSGSKSYLELLKEANLTSPFEDGFVEKIINKISPKTEWKEEK